MKGKKLLVLVISVLMILSVPIIIYGFNFNSVTFNKNIYKKEFLKYNVYAKLENYDIESVNCNVLNYLTNEKGNILIDGDFFNEREKAHLLDVKNLIQKTFLIYYSSATLFLISLILLIFLLNFNIQKILKIFLFVLLFGTALTLLDAVLFYILSNFNFTFIFDEFHKTFFSSGTYSFNPEYEKIVVLYPKNLFSDILTSIITHVIFSSVVVLFFCAILLFLLKK